ncbi:hypothetical protein [Oleisolibacter albus]|nr:hypothetical protein [Oleisolibacter albus]
MAEEHRDETPSQPERRPWTAPAVSTLAVEELTQAFNGGLGDGNTGS